MSNHICATFLIQQKTLCHFPLVMGFKSLPSEQMVPVSVATLVSCAQFPASVWMCIRLHLQV